MRLPRVDDLSTPGGLEGIVGAVRHVDRVPLETAGFSGARHERLTVQLHDGAHVQLVIKRFSLVSSWTAYRTGDVVGREAALLSDAAFGGIWEIFRSPYLAYATEGDDVGLLMTDLSDVLLPEGGAQLTVVQADRFIESLAALHGRFWESDVLETDWLAPPAVRFHILHPAAAEEEGRRSAAPPLFALVGRGWEQALSAVPPRVAACLRRPAAASAGDFAHLPQTLLHGDTKVANFAFFPNGAIAAFDWATMGRGPAAFDLGYCLAINTAVLPVVKETVLARYRSALEATLGRRLPDGLWRDLVSAAVMAGAGMLLWSKALALDARAPGAADEWAWWVGELERRVG